MKKKLRLEPVLYEVRLGKKYLGFLDYSCEGVWKGEFMFKSRKPRKKLELTARVVVWEVYQGAKRVGSIEESSTGSLPWEAILYGNWEGALGCFKTRAAALKSLEKQLKA